MKNTLVEMKGRLQTINSGEGLEKREPFYTIGGKVNWYSHYGEQLPYDLAIPFLGIHLKKTIIQKDLCTPMFIAALFTIARAWNNLKLSINRGMDKEDVVHIYNGILLSHKKEQNNAICSNMDGPRDCHTE